MITNNNAGIRTKTPNSVVNTPNRIRYIEEVIADALLDTDFITIENLLSIQNLYEFNDETNLSKELADVRDYIEGIIVTVIEERDHNNLKINKINDFEIILKDKRILPDSHILSEYEPEVFFELLKTLLAFGRDELVSNQLDNNEFVLNYRDKKQIVNKIIGTAFNKASLSTIKSISNLGLDRETVQDVIDLMLEHGYNSEEDEDKYVIYKMYLSLLESSEELEIKREQIRVIVDNNDVTSIQEFSIDDEKFFVETVIHFSLLLNKPDILRGLFFERQNRVDEISDEHFLDAINLGVIECFEELVDYTSPSDDVWARVILDDLDEISQTIIEIQ